MADKKIRSVAKTFSWRFLIFVYWMIFGYIFTGTFKVIEIISTVLKIKVQVNGVSTQLSVWLKLWIIKYKDNFKGVSL